MSELLYLMHSNSLFQGRNLPPKYLITELNLRDHIATPNQGKPQERRKEGWWGTSKRPTMLIVSLGVDLQPKYLNASQNHEFQGRIAEYVKQAARFKAAKWPFKSHEVAK